MFEILFAGVQQDLKIFLLAPLMCAAFRAIFLWRYGPKEWTPEMRAALPECFRYAFWWGLDFNAYVFLASFLLVSLPAAFLPAYAAAADTARTGLIMLYLFILYLAFIGKMIFYYHFHDTFNQTLRLGRHADKMNFVDIFFHQNHGALVLLSFIPYLALTLALAAGVLAIPTLSALALSGLSGTVGAVLLVLFAVALFYWLRYGGTFRHRLKPEWDEVPASVRGSVFLGQAVRDDLIALELALKAPVVEALKHSDEEAREVLAPLLDFSPERREKDFWRSFQRSAQGARIKKPSRIFYLLGESWTRELLEPEWASLRLMEEGRRVMAEPGSVEIADFLSAGPNSRPSLTSQLLGVYDAGLELNERQAFWQGAPPTALAKQLGRLGYHTAFWYGGAFGHGSLEHFVPAAGFDEAYSGPLICPDAPATWLGIYDHTFLEETARRIKASSRDFEMHFIYTTSNHGPYLLDLEKEGLDLGDFLREAPEVYRNAHGLLKRQLRAIRYADLALMKFLREMREAYPDALFIVTGDHSGGLLPADKAKEAGLRASAELTLRERCAPGFFMHHRDLKKEMLPAELGSHMSIQPTLLELIAPAGFEYFSIERPLTEKVTRLVTPYDYLTENEIGHYETDERECRSGENHQIGGLQLAKERAALIELSALLVRHPELMEKA